MEKESNLEHYCMLTISEKNPGLKIIQKKELSKFIEKNTKSIPVNYGDFYSEIPVKDLSTVVKKALNKNLKEDLNIILIGHKKFNLMMPKAKNDYLIKESHGIRFYSSKIHQNYNEKADEVYSLIGFSIIEDLFYNKRKGKLQTNFSKMGREFKLMLEEPY